MEHDIFFDGNKKKYSWSIKTESEIANQIREHPPSVHSGGKLDVKNNDESKFIALHSGIFWGLGVNIINDHDAINVMCDSKMMFEIIIKKEKTENKIINDKVYFINQLTNLRKLKINYKLIKPEKNISTKHLLAKKDTAERDSRNYV